MRCIQLMRMADDFVSDFFSVKKIIPTCTSMFQTCLGQFAIQMQMSCMYTSYMYIYFFTSIQTSTLKHKHLRISHQNMSDSYFLSLWIELMSVVIMCGDSTPCHVPSSVCFVTNPNTPQAVQEIFDADAVWNRTTCRVTWPQSNQAALETERFKKENPSYVREVLHFWAKLTAHIKKSVQKFELLRN